MSLVQLSHVCSHLQNTSRARIGMTSIPFSNLHLSLSQQLQKSGFISTVSVGSHAQPPHISPVLTVSPADNAEISPYTGDPKPLVTQQNLGSRRVWLGMKYYNNEPVLSKMRMISKPTRRIWLGALDLAKITRGQKAGYVEGLRQVGECLYVSTDRGIMEVREAVERGLGGQVLCRVL